MFTNYKDWFGGSILTLFSLWNGSQMYCVLPSPSGAELTLQRIK